MWTVHLPNGLEGLVRWCAALFTGGASFPGRGMVPTYFSVIRTESNRQLQNPEIQLVYKELIGKYLPVAEEAFVVNGNS